MPAIPKKRLDQWMVDLGLAESREKAQRLIRAGRVRVNDDPAEKPGHSYPASAVIRVIEPERFVSRGGEKLEAAFAQWPLDVAGRVCLDIGASTGGFTDCMLQHGAARVYAVDVGESQLHSRLRTDPRVTVVDHCNARTLDASRIPEPAAFAAADVSFISLTKVLPAVTNVLAPGATLVTLIKPQFEAGRDQVGAGGVVRDEAVRGAVVDRIRLFGEGELGLAWLGVIPSPLKGPAGNVEYLACWKKPSEPSA